MLRKYIGVTWDRRDESEISLETDKCMKDPNTIVELVAVTEMEKIIDSCVCTYI